MPPRSMPHRGMHSVHAHIPALATGVTGSGRRCPADEHLVLRGVPGDARHEQRRLARLTSDVIPSLTLPGVTTDSSATPIQDIGLGIGFAGTNVFNPQPALDLWFDDVIVDTQPLTCAD